MLTRQQFDPPQGLSDEGRKIVAALQQYLEQLNKPGALDIADNYASGPVTIKHEAGTSLYVGNNLSGDRSDNTTDVLALWMNQLHTNASKYAILDGGVLRQAYTSQPSAGAGIGSALDRWMIACAQSGGPASLTIDESNTGTFQWSGFADTGKTLNVTLARALKIREPSILSGTCNVTSYYGLDIEDQSGIGTNWAPLRLRSLNYIKSRNAADSADVSMMGLNADDHIDLGTIRKGTFTPVLSFGTPGNLSVSYTRQTGNYVRIGQVVIVTVNILTSAFTHTTASGALAIAGLPFTAAASPLLNPGSSTIWRGITKAGYTQVTPIVGATTDFVVFTLSGSGVTPANVSTGDMPTGGTVELDFTVIYSV